MDVLTIIGTLASIGGAGVSIWQAKSAYKSAAEAEITANTIREKQELQAIEGILKKASEIDEMLISLKTKGRAIQGIKTNKCQVSIERFISLISRESLELDDIDRDLLNAQIDSLKDNLNLFKSEKEDLLDIINSIHEDIRTIITIFGKVKKNKEFK